MIQPLTLKVSVVVSYYKNLPNLELILLALENQTAKGTFEVILSEDDDAPETVVFLEKRKSNYSFPIIHLSQPDDGFRKNKALNKAINTVTTDFVIFLDGDCIPHKRLVQEYIEAKKENKVLYGRRMLLSEKISTQLLEEKRLNLLNIFNFVRSGCKRLEEGLYLKFIPQFFKIKKSSMLVGCNMGISKKDLIAINGFDEDYVSAGHGEDSDIEWRLKASGASFFSMKFRAITYHLYHIERPAHELKNLELFNRKVQLGHFICKNGLKKI